MLPSRKRLLKHGRLFALARFGIRGAAFGDFGHAGQFEADRRTGLGETVEITGRKILFGAGFQPSHRKKTYLAFIRSRHANTAAQYEDVPVLMSLAFRAASQAPDNCSDWPVSAAFLPYPEQPTSFRCCRTRGFQDGTRGR